MTPGPAGLAARKRYPRRDGRALPRLGDDQIANYLDALRELPCGLRPDRSDHVSGRKMQAAERLARLIEPVHDRVLAFARCLCRSRADGDDLYQEALLRALTRLDALRDETAFRPWLYRILITREQELTGLSAIVPDDAPTAPTSSRL